MNVKLDLQTGTCVVTREAGDPLFKPAGWLGHGNYTNGPESTFLYHVKRELQKQGYDVIKKRMGKDGHLVDDRQQYLRTRKWTHDGGISEFCIWNSSWQIWDAGERFNQDGEVTHAAAWKFQSH